VKFLASRAFQPGNIFGILKALYHLLIFLNRQNYRYGFTIARNNFRFSVSQLAIELHVSVKTIETHEMRIKGKLALGSAAELREKAREWMAKSALNLMRRHPEREPQMR